MEATSPYAGRAINLEELREEAVRKIGIVMALVTYFWLMFLLFVPTGGDAPLESWLGALTLCASMILALSLARRMPLLARLAQVAGVFAAVCLAVVASGSLAMGHLFVLATLFGSVLLGQSAIGLTAVAAVLFMGLYGFGRLGLPFVSGEIWLPIGTVVLTAIGAWVSARNMLVALDWVSHGYEQARRNEQEARQRRAELRRALHALDEATVRVERSRDELIVARRQAEEARVVKEQFVTTVSHELRTPLNLIVGFVEMMYLSPESYRGVVWTPELENDIREMYRASRHLESLVNDILDLSRIDAARLPMFRELSDLRTIVRDAAATIAPLIAQRGLSLEIKLPDGLPELFVDRTRIRQVLLNLLNNAVRFTDEGTISIAVTQTDEAVVISVRDTGIGIPEDQLERIFDQFGQVEMSPRQRGGTGLGLALSRQFAELHGGRVWAESKLGAGSTFYVSLPLPGTVLQAEPVRRTPDRRRADLSGAPLVVVDPDPDLAVMVSRYLSDRPIIAATDEAEADACIEDHHPLAVIVNQPPDVDARDWLAPLGENADRYNVPVFRCSIPSASWLRRSSLLDEVLTKPVSRHAVQQLLRRYCRAPSTVLVVDDDPGFVSLMMRMLGGMDCVQQVLPAYDGKQAVKLAREARPQLMLLDLLMPEMDGFEVLAAVREDPQLANMVVAAVTGNSYPDEVLSTSRGCFALSQSRAITPGTVTELLRVALRIVRPDYASYANTEASVSSSLA